MKSPKIRFKHHAGEEFPNWSSKKIGEILEIKHGKDYKNLPLGDIPVLGTGGIITYVSLFLCNWPCVLIGRKGTINKPQFMDKPFWSVDTLFYSKPKKHNSPRFQYYLFQTINWLKYSEATGVPSLSASTIENIAKSVPCLEEQEKIASFFSTLDQKIELNERKLEALEKLKKGVIQKIFSQKLRFKDKLGTPYPTWKTAPLGYEAFVFDGTHQTPKYTLDGIPFVSVEDINSLSSITKYISEEAYLTDFKASCRAKKGDIFMTRIGDIGTPSICPKDDIAYYVSLALIKCKNNLSNNFLKFAIESDKFQSELRKRSILTAFPKKINTGEIGKCLISLPCMDEQQKIASFFSALDQKIELNERKLEGLKKLKKGLMQQMFV